LYIPNFLDQSDLTPLWQDIDLVVEAFSDSLGLSKDSRTTQDQRDRSLLKILKKRPDLQSVLYDRLQMMPRLLAFAAQPKILEISQQVLGTHRIGVWPRMQLRFDKQHDEKNLIGWHTDYLYNQGTSDSVTFWIPIVNVTSLMGMLLFARGTHKNSHLNFVKRDNGRRFHYDLEEDTLKTLDIFSHEKYNAGDLILFHSQLAHSGQINEDPDRARLTILFRMQNLNNLEAFQSDSI
jgi:hypothetical protein